MISVWIWIRPSVFVHEENNHFTTYPKRIPPYPPHLRWPTARSPARCISPEGPTPWRGQRRRRHPAFCRIKIARVGGSSLPKERKILGLDGELRDCACRWWFFQCEAVPETHMRWKRSAIPNLTKYWSSRDAYRKLMFSPLNLEVSWFPTKFAVTKSCQTLQASKFHSQPAWP